jgi:hypothetical protein
MSAASPDPVQIWEESIPAIRDILSGVGCPMESYTMALRMLKDIVSQSPHAVFTGSGIVKCLVDWLRYGLFAQFETVSDNYDIQSSAQQCRYPMQTLCLPDLPVGRTRFGHRLPSSN